jgi:hypothetical protein
MQNRRVRLDDRPIDQPDDSVSHMEKRKQYLSNRIFH